MRQMPTRCQTKIGQNRNSVKEGRLTATQAANKDRLITIKVVMLLKLRTLSLFLLETGLTDNECFINPGME